MLDRVIDLGCGDPRPEFLSSLPRHREYVGVDICDHAGSPSFEHPRRRFIRSDALRALSELVLMPHDLIVSTFAAHHIGIPALLRRLDDLGPAGPQYAIVDAAVMDENSFARHFARSLAASVASALGMGGTGGRHAAMLSRSQARFLASRSGVRHAREDYRSGRQRSAASLQDRADVIAFSSLWCAVKGDSANDWLRA